MARTGLRDQYKFPLFEIVCWNEEHYDELLRVLCYSPEARVTACFGGWTNGEKCLVLIEDEWTAEEMKEERHYEIDYVKVGKAEDFVHYFPAEIQEAYNNGFKDYIMDYEDLSYYDKTNAWSCEWTKFEQEKLYGWLLPSGKFIQTRYEGHRYTAYNYFERTDPKRAEKFYSEFKAKDACILEEQWLAIGDRRITFNWEIFNDISKKYSKQQINFLLDHMDKLTPEAKKNAEEIIRWQESN